MTLVCIVCRKVMDAEVRLIGTTCPYCETGELRIAPEEAVAEAEIER